MIYSDVLKGGGNGSNFRELVNIKVKAAQSLSHGVELDTVAATAVATDLFGLVDIVSVCFVKQDAD